ncbi:hypothetical protein ABIA85_009652 [Bradyrhizobium sp. LA6.10]
MHIAIDDTYGPVMHGTSRYVTGKRTINYRRWPSPIPICNAFWRRAPAERLVSFAILTTGVLALE